jgi:hypothetical protein|tara:strand:+ start:2777 stop:2899 length:123 start_codon:yes stop_codon:yes gene_type:complete
MAKTEPDLSIGKKAAIEGNFDKASTIFLNAIKWYEKKSKA